MNSININSSIKIDKHKVMNEVVNKDMFGLLKYKLVCLMIYMANRFIDIIPIRINQAHNDYEQFWNGICYDIFFIGVIFMFEEMARTCTGNYNKYRMIDIFSEPMGFLPFSFLWHMMLSA